VTLENYIQTTGSKAPTLKVEGEYLLIQKDFKQRIFSVRKFIYDSKLNNVMIPINRKILIEYQNEVFPFENYNISEKSETIFFKINLNTREFRRLDGGEEGDLKSHGIGLYVAWTLLSYMMLITGRYMKYFYLWRMILHTALGVIILILTIIFVSMAGENEGKSKINSFGKAHGSFSSLTYPWLIFELVSGVLVKIALMFLVHASWVGIW